MIDHCSWDNPGANPYVGRTEEAIYRYADIPSSTQQALIDKIKQKRIDDVAFIKRDSVEGRYNYSDLRQMHFGKNSVCAKVRVNKWTDSQTEIGLVYCVGEHCVIVPTVCGNISRITRTTKPEETGDGEWRPSTEQMNKVPQSVPEPTTLLLVSTAIAGMLYLRKKQNG